MKDPTNEDSEGDQISNGCNRTHAAHRHDHGGGIHIAPFEELCGRFIGFQRTDVDLVIQLSAGILEFPLNSTEAAICENELEGNAGNWVSILRTSDPDRPLLVNSQESTEIT